METILNKESRAAIELMIADGIIAKDAAERYFPELKESEDKRMRNAAINACKYMVDNFENSTKQYEDAIAWLEKQGEQKEINYNEEFKKCKANPLYFFDKYVKVKLKEQKSAWSEEDKFCIQALLHYCEQYQIKDSDRLRCLKWLKFIKERYTWKPSDEQMEALDYYLKNTINNDCGFGRQLVKLYHDLKKLKE